LEELLNFGESVEEIKIEGIGRNEDLLPYFTRNLLRICKKRKDRAELRVVAVINI